MVKPWYTLQLAKLPTRRYHRLYTRRSAAERKAITTASQQARPTGRAFFVPEAVQAARPDTPNQKVTLCISDNCDQHSTAPEARQAHESIISTLHKIQLIKMHTSAISLKHKLKQLPTHITIKYKHYLTLKSFCAPSRPDHLHTTAWDGNTYHIDTHIQAKNTHISVYNAYSYSYTAISAKQHRGQINTVKQREAEQATEQEAPKAKRNGLNPYILKALRASGLP